MTRDQTRIILQQSTKMPNAGLLAKSLQRMPEMRDCHKERKTNPEERQTCMLSDIGHIGASHSGLVKPFSNITCFPENVLGKY